MLDAEAFDTHGQESAGENLKLYLNSIKGEWVTSKFLLHFYQQHFFGNLFFILIQCHLTITIIILLYSKIVLVTIQDEGSKYVKNAEDALKRLGATDPILTDYRGSFCLVGYAGDTKPSWITQQQHNGGEGPAEISLQIPYPPGT